MFGYAKTTRFSTNLRFFGHFCGFAVPPIRELAGPRTALEIASGAALTTPGWPQLVHTARHPPS
jgi:hypothetical protein